MTAGKCHLELYLDGAWTLAAEVRCDDVRGGIRSSTRVEYDFDYLENVACFDARDHRAVSCRHPVGYGIHADDVWPAFLLDVIPSGAARRHWEAQLGLPNTASSDWAILVAGGGNSPELPSLMQVEGASDDVRRTLEPRLARVARELGDVR